jgi:type I restriction enzyme M protein
MIIDARKQFDKEPKSFGSKRNRLLDEHRNWIEEQYKNGWKEGYKNECVKIFNTKDFAYHKVRVVFWQTDDKDQPAMIKEPFNKPLTQANVKKEQEFYDSDIDFALKIASNGKTQEIALVLKPKDSFTEKFEEAMRQVFGKEMDAFVAEDATGREKTKALKEFLKEAPIEAQYKHRHYIEDDEYIPYGEDIEAFLKREIGKPVIRWQDGPQFGYEILPNKYFYKYVPPEPADELIKKFWDLENQASNLIKKIQ